MFKTIVESVMNEIAATDAYNKFYSKIPSNQFFSLIELYNGKFGTLDTGERDKLKFDNLLKAICNSILPGNGYNFNQAYKFIQDYKSASNEIRIAFLNNFRANKYEDLGDMIYGLEDLSKNGVDTAGNFEKNGYIVVAKDEEWTMTCTTTYMANHHYFGNTNWCTASDRLGNYDGWLFFQRYVFNDMDYDPNGIEEMMDDPNFDINDYDEEDQERFEVYSPEYVCAALVQYIKNDKSKIYQAQILKNGAIKVVCDEKDAKVEINDFIEMLSYAMQQATMENANTLINKTKISMSKEEPYQTSKNDYYIEKRIKKEKLKNEIRERLAPKAVAKQKAKAEFVIGKFKQLLETNLLENKEYLEQLIKNNGKIPFYNRDIKEEDFNKAELLLQSQNYAYVNNFYKITDSIVALTIAPCLGLTEALRNDNNGMPSLIKQIIRKPDIDTGEDFSTGRFVIANVSNISAIGAITHHAPKIDYININSIIFSKICDTNIGNFAYQCDQNDYPNNSQTAINHLSNYFIFRGNYSDDSTSFLVSKNPFKIFTIETNAVDITSTDKYLWLLSNRYDGKCSRLDYSTNQIEVFNFYETDAYSSDPDNAFIVLDSEKLHIVVPPLTKDFYFDLAITDKLSKYDISHIEYDQYTKKIKISMEYDYSARESFEYEIPTQQLYFNEKYFKKI